MMGFGKNIMKKRLEKGYSKEYAAINIGCTVSSLNSWEAEIRNPTLKKAKAIADFYETSVNDLMGLPEDKLRNMANIKHHPEDQQSVDRVNKMRDAGLSEEQIDRIVHNAATLASMIDSLNLNGNGKNKTTLPAQRGLFVTRTD